MAPPFRAFWPVMIPPVACAAALNVCRFCRPAGFGGQPYGRGQVGPLRESHGGEDTAKDRQRMTVRTARRNSMLADGGDSLRTNTTAYLSREFGYSILLGAVLSPKVRAAILPSSPACDCNPATYTTIAPRTMTSLFAGSDCKPRASLLTGLAICLRPMCSDHLVNGLLDQFLVRATAAHIAFLEFV